MFAVTVFAVLLCLAAASYDTADDRCHRVGQFLPLKNGYSEDRCTYLICTYGDEPWQDTYGNYKYYTQEQECPYGTFIPEYHTFEGYASTNPCVGTGYNKHQCGKPTYKHQQTYQPSYAPTTYNTGYGYQQHQPAQTYRPQGYQALTYTHQTYQAPTYTHQTYQAPSYSAPSAYQAPSYQAPSYQAPSYQAPSYQPASYQPAMPAYQPAVQYKAPTQYKETSYKH